jgi:hypothetical protein
MAKPPAVVPASHSSMDAYSTCPKQFYEVRIAKKWPQQESPEMKWGNDVHKALENNIKYKRPLPAAMAMYQWGLDLLANVKPDTKVNAELDVAVTRDLMPTGFWDNDCYLRGKIDVLAINGEQTAAVNLDWKTGKTKPNSKQLLLSTLMCFGKYPHLEKVKTGFVWLPEADPAKRLTQKLYSRVGDQKLLSQDDKGKMIVNSFDELWEPFHEKVSEMEWSLQHDTWPANPSGLCKQWCPVLTCPHNGKRTT